MNFPDAAASCRVPALLIKLDAGADLEERDTKGRTALFRAAQVGRFENVDLLLARDADPNAQDHVGETPLRAAARHGHLECVRVLVRAGARLDDCPTPGLIQHSSETALCCAVRKEFTGIAELLLDAGANPNVASATGRRPLHLAAILGNLALCRVLATKGADLNANEEGYGTALHQAVMASRLETVRELLRLGANVDARDSEERTPLMGAVVLADDCVPFVFEILKSKPDLDARDYQGESALDIACSRGKKEIAEILVGAGARRTRDEDENTSGFSIEIAPGVEFGMSLDPFSVPVEKKDESLAAELPKSPILVRYLGWRSSHAHWCLLGGDPARTGGGTFSPRTLAGLAYFARGYRNHADGPVADGPDILGESYQTAVERFLEEGLVGILGPHETLAEITTAATLKGVAASAGLKAHGRKAELLDAILGQCGYTPFQALLEENTLYQISETGRAEFANCAAHRENARARLEQEMLAAFTDGALVWGLSLAQNLLAVTQTFRPFSAREASQARLILENAVPEELDYSTKDLARLRAVAAAVALFCSEKDVWPETLRDGAPTYDGVRLSPSDFGLTLIGGKVIYQSGGEN